MMTNDFAVVYNRYNCLETRTIAYKPTLLGLVYWEGAKAANVSQSGLDGADSLKVLIPLRGIDFNDKQFVDALTYKNLSDEERDNYFTLAVGDKIIKGNIIYDSKELDKKVQSFTITKVDEKLFGSYHMQHFEVGAV